MNPTIPVSKIEIFFKVTFFCLALLCNFMLVSGIHPRVYLFLLFVTLFQKEFYYFCKGYLIEY